MTQAVTPAAGGANLDLYKARDLGAVDAVAEALAFEARGGNSVSPFDLTRIKLPAGGGTHWAIPKPDGTEDAAATFEGIILDVRDTRVYWESSFSGGGNPPDCAATDGEIGHGAYGVGSVPNPSGACATCPMSEFGSRGDGQPGQACRQVRQVFLLRPGELLPTLLFVPPSSLKPFKRYVLSLASGGITPFGVVTRFALTKAQSKGGIAYSQIAATQSTILPPEDRVWADNYRTRMMPLFTATAHAVSQGQIVEDED